MISLPGPCDFSRGRGERQSPAALTDSLQGPRVNSVLRYKFPFVELPGLIDLGAKFPFLKEDLSGLVKSGACFQPQSRRVNVRSTCSAILNHVN